MRRLFATSGCLSPLFFGGGWSYEIKITPLHLLEYFFRGVWSYGRRAFGKRLAHDNNESGSVFGIIAHTEPLNPHCGFWKDGVMERYPVQGFLKCLIMAQVNGLENTVSIINKHVSFTSGYGKRKTFPTKATFGIIFPTAIFLSPIPDQFLLSGIP